MIIDTEVPVENALVSMDGWDRPVGGASTIVACACVQELITRAAALLAKRGELLPTFVSPTVPGASLEANDEVFLAYARRLVRTRSTTEE